MDITDEIYIENYTGEGKQMANKKKELEAHLIVIVIWRTCNIWKSKNVRCTHMYVVVAASIAEVRCYNSHAILKFEAIDMIIIEDQFIV